VRFNRRDENNEFDVNLTPLIDVVFLLLIFFMVTTTFKRESEIELSLPEASGEAVERDRAPFELVVDANGEYKIDGRTIFAGDIVQLKSVLLTAREGREHLPFVIRADGQAPHQAVVWAMDAAGQLNIQRIAFATVTEDVSVFEEEQQSQ
jgi:biopolymer transport protein ExbD